MFVYFWTKRNKPNHQCHNGKISSSRWNSLKTLLVSTDSSFSRERARDRHLLLYQRWWIDAIPLPFRGKEYRCPQFIQYLLLTPFLERRLQPSTDVIHVACANILLERARQSLVLTSDVHYAIIIKQTIEDWMIIKKRERDEPERRERRERSVFMFAHTHREEKSKKENTTVHWKGNIFQNWFEFSTERKSLVFFSLQRDAVDGSTASRNRWGQSLTVRGRR